MWNQRYANREYVYGTEPNLFFKEQILKLTPGKLLLPAEGEGRNGVFAALNGWEVVAFDSSTVAKEKAQKLSVKNKVLLNYLVSSFESFHFQKEWFDSVALIFAHSPQRERVHKKMIQFLKPGGKVILTGFSKDQILYNTGGPRQIEMLFSQKELEEDFSNLSHLEVWKEVVNHEEGSHHSGKASVIRLLGEK